ncbi:MAG: nucleotidyltransferase family protein [Oscillospiraceae bacterium]|nr:nucleotidyltransferase family protein [Oscillospiraceae bacterium]
MKITGIICEYNPFHLGHFKQLRAIREQNADTGIVCLMSGNYVQRGMPAIFDKAHRAKAAVMCGADLVLELPVTAALSSAEGFADQGVRILSGFCDSLSFGAEDALPDLLMKTAQALLRPDFPEYLKAELSKGLSFPAARQNALEAMGLNADSLNKPNNILAIEYCKAILSQNSKMKPEPISRGGDYHETTADTDNPSASAVRLLLENNKPWQNYVPKNAIDCFENANIHTVSNGEQAILYRLRTMTDEEFEALPYGSEGLWRKLMRNARQYATLEEIIVATKSKRYTRTRLDRMIMCAYLGLTAENITSPAPYVRVLALNDKGREILLKARQSGHFPNIGERIDHSYQAIENRCDDLYGFFAQSRPKAPGLTNDRRIYYHK